MDDLGGSLDAAQRTVSCPQCGAVDDAAGDDAFAACGFCGASLHVEQSDVPHETMVPAVPEAEIAAHLARWLRSREAIGTPATSRASLVLLPFWLLPDRPLVAAAPPLTTVTPGLDAAPAGDLKRFHGDLANGARVVSPTVPLQSLLRPGAPPSGVRLLHLPFWDVTYTLVGREHTALVDAVAGTVVPLTFPAATGERWRDWAHAAVFVALSVVVFRAWREVLWYESIQAPSAWHLLAAGPAAYAVLWAASFVRSR